MSSSDNPYRPPSATVADIATSGPVEAFGVPGARVRAGRGLAWIGEGWDLFRARRGMWVAVCFLLVAFDLLLVRVVGENLANIVVGLLGPFISAGLLAFGHAIARGEPAVLDQLFIGFRQRAGTLLALALIGMLLVFVLAILLGLGIIVMLGGFAVLLSGNPSLIMETLVAGGGLLGLLLLTPLILLGIGLLGAAYWFAPGLVLFAGLGAWTSLRESFRACVRNWLPFLIYGLLLLLAIVVVALPVGIVSAVLGTVSGDAGATLTGLVVMALLMPVLFGSYYISFRDLFGRSA